MEYKKKALKASTPASAKKPTNSDKQVLQKTVVKKRSDAPAAKATTGRPGIIRQNSSWHGGMKKGEYKPTNTTDPPLASSVASAAKLDAVTTVTFNATADEVVANLSSPASSLAITTDPGSLGSASSGRPPAPREGTVRRLSSSSRKPSFAMTRTLTKTKSRGVSFAMGLLNDNEGTMKTEDENDDEDDNGDSEHSRDDSPEAYMAGVRAYPVHPADILIMLLFFPIAVSDNEHARARRNYYAFRYIEYISIGAVIAVRVLVDGMSSGQDFQAMLVGKSAYLIFFGTVAAAAVLAITLPLARIFARCLDRRPPQQKPPKGPAAAPKQRLPGQWLSNSVS